jgi:hypothetical protein
MGIPQLSTFVRCLSSALALTILIGCDRTLSSPTSPAVVSQTVIPPPIVPKVSIARLELLNASVVTTRDGYYPGFLLKETSGQSAAIIKSVNVANDAGRVTVTDDGCWGRTTVIRVNAGSTFDGFDGRYANPLLQPDPYDYCGAYSLDGPTSQLRVTVIFADESGTIGTVTASIPTS